MQTEQLTNQNERIVTFLKNTKLGYLKIYEKMAQDGFDKKIFTKQPNIALLHATLLGTMFQSMNGLAMYKEYYQISEDDLDYDDQYFQDLSTHIKQVLKNLLGYEENK